MVVHRYFKLKCLYGDTDWIYNEFKSGRIRFGWSERGCNLKEIQKKIQNKEPLTQKERISWGRTKFLIERIKPEDRVVLFFEQPGRQFLIAEITGPYEYPEPKDEREDFNHILPCKPLTPDYINLYSAIIPFHVRHDLMKRGRYYEIYDEKTRKRLDEIIENKEWESKKYKEKRSLELEIDELKDKIKDKIIKKTYKEISSSFPVKEFEKFIGNLLKKIKGIEVKEQKDSKKGWDLLIQIRDPLTDEIFADNIPVQCKNYKGKVDTNAPIKDLERCVKNLDTNKVYLIINGELEEDFYKKILEKQEELTTALGKEIQFNVVNQERIAELYLSYGMVEEDESH